MRELPAEYGDYNFYEDANKVFHLDATFPSGENYRFFNEISDFVRYTPSLIEGKFRSGFYIKSIDYSDSDEATSDVVIRLRRATSFLQALRKFSAVSTHSGEIENFGKLFFFRPSDFGSPPRTAVIPLELNEKFADFSMPSFEILNQLSSSKIDAHIHIEERRLILSDAIADVAKDHPQEMPSLEYLARNWRQVLIKYRQNLLAYVSKFTFDVERKKIADSAIEYSTRLASTLNEIAGKLVAAPISAASLFALGKVSGGVEFLAGCVGVFSIFIIYRTLLRNQLRQVSRLQSSYKFILNGFLVKKATFPMFIRNELTKLEEEAEAQSKSIAWTSIVYTVISYMPVAAIVYLIYLKYDIFIFDFVLKWFG
jgi:hypothetical protein